MRQNVIFLIIFAFVIGINQAEAAEEEELIYLDLEKNNELVKQKVSNAFWENPFNTPPMLILIGVAILMVFISWKRKWHIHERKID